MVAYAVAQRARELGIRAALGATTSELLALVMRQGARLVVGGVAVGFVLALGFGRVLGSLLYRVDATDPLAFLVVGAALAMIALVASAIPAQRAARANPASVLRIE